MNMRVYILAAAAFIVGTVEFIIGGILKLVADDLDVSIGAAGQLISVFSLFFAFSAPVLLNITAKMERKQLYIWTMFVFLLGNILAAMSADYTMLMIARILTAITGSLLIVLTITIASGIVAPAYQGRAIGTVFMGISASLVLGVPFGMVIGNAFGWRTTFIVMSVLTVVAIICIYKLLDPIEPKPVVPIRKQIQALRSSKILSAQFITFFMLTGHLTLYAYLTPFLQDALGLAPSIVTAVYFIFGTAAVIGGGLGGWLSDKWGPQRSILTIISLFAIVLTIFPLATKLPLYVFLIILVIWSALSWAIAPAQQTYLIESAPETADIQMGLNTSASHFGIALGSLIGGIVIEKSSVLYNAWAGVVFILLALTCAIFSVTRRSEIIETNLTKS
jgi:DHA1 family purine base/nucleoside efflux pump-like MFS transporter